MTTIQINVGLVNNPLTEDEVIAYFASSDNYRLIAFQVLDSTFVGLLEYKYNRQSKILQDFENIACTMNQSFISLVTDRIEALAFNPNYKGEDYKFDSRYFKYIKL